MIEDLKPYPEYWDSRLGWLGEIPSHWRVVRNGSLFGQRNQTGYGELPILEVSLKTGVRVRDFVNSPRKQIMSDAAKYKRAVKGDLSYNMMRMWQGAVGVAPVDGLVSPAYVVARPYSGVESRFYAELFRTSSYMAEVDNCSRGIVKDRNRLYWDQFKQILSPLLPPKEQSAILRFLDYANWKIDRFIRAKRKLISALDEQRRIIIHDAVTGGLDPSARLKPSGIPWIGDMPEHWQLSRVKNQFTCLNSRRVPLSAIERGHMTDARYDYYGASGVIDRVDDYIFDDDLLLIAEDGANLVLRNLPLAIIARGKFWVNNHAHILKPKGGKLEYLAGYMETLNYQPWISGAAQPKLTKDRLMSITLAVAPCEEQVAIVEAFTERTKPVRAAIARTEREVALMQEYRSRLTSDIVTGKLDVREAATGLPDLPRDQELTKSDARSEEDGEGAEAEVSDE
jgi:type I restriction enzyme S subunit